MPLKILSWNVNGLRSFKQPMIEFLGDLNSEIICMQETKITRDMLTEDLAIIEGFTSYFSFSRKRSGYSGVATYVRESCTPVYAAEGLCGTLVPDLRASAPIHKEELSDDISPVISAVSSPLPGNWTMQSLRDIDNEGRTVITLHCFVPTGEATGEVCLAEKPRSIPLAVINVYCPRADPERADRGLYKLQFYRALRLRAALLAEAGARVVVVGDLNTSHQRLDHCDPDEDFHLNPGRKFLDALLLKSPDHMHTFRQDSRDCTSEEPSENENPIRSADESCSVMNVSTKEREYATELENSCETRKDLIGRPVDLGADSSDSENSENQINNEENYPLSFEKTDQNGFEDDGNSADPLMDLKIYREFRMVDTFRFLYPSKKDAFSCWNTRASARSNNYGTRIDYVLCDELFFRLVEDSLVLQDIMGSDHCPVACICRANIIPADKLPQLCSKNFVEFQGEQQNLFNYFQKIQPSDRAQSVAPDIKGTDKCVTSLVSEETRDSGKKCKPLDSFFVKSDGKTRERGPQETCRRDVSIQYKRASHSSSPSLGEKRKNSFNNNGVKNKQSKLNSFFAPSNAKVSSQQTAAVVKRELRTFSLPSGQKLAAQGLAASADVEENGKLSLYEAELKYLRENPNIYEQLNLKNNGEINMEVFSKTENSNFEIDAKPDEDAISAFKFSIRDAPGMCDRSPSFSDSNEHSASPTGTTCDSNEVLSSQPDDENTPTFTSDTSRGSGKVDEPMQASQIARHDEEITAAGHCLNTSNGSSRARVVPDWSFLGKKVVAPLCTGHNEPAVLRTSKKKGVNFNRKFYACAKGVGRPGQKDAQCNFFKWV